MNDSSLPKLIAALGVGALFGLGLSVGGMVNPGKVLAFLDLAGDWDPSLLFVMGGGVAVTSIAFHFVLRRPVPLLGGSFSVPTRSDLDARLIIGSALFGVGWGLAGICPGPAFAVVGYAVPDLFYFLGAMIAGAGLYEVTLAPPKQTTAPAE